MKKSAQALANTQTSASKQTAQAKPKGLLRLLCAGDAENVNQPGFSVEPFLWPQISFFMYYPGKIKKPLRKHLSDFWWR